MHQSNDVLMPIAEIGRVALGEVPSGRAQSPRA